MSPVPPCVHERFFLETVADIDSGRTTAQDSNRALAEYSRLGKLNFPVGTDDADLGILGTQRKAEEPLDRFSDLPQARVDVSHSDFSQELIFF